MSKPRRIEVKKNILAKNDNLANENRTMLRDHNVTTFNFMSSPGSGKTSLLVRTIFDLREKLNIVVIEGDQQTDNDAKRIMETGVPVVQLNTVNACHLDADMTRKALDQLDLDETDILFIENVGNLVCPASYDLGEEMKIALLSVTEGEDKPAKYPKMFRESSILLITKTDLAPYVEFDIDKCIGYAKAVNPKIETIALSAKTGDGMDEWYRCITELTRE